MTWRQYHPETELKHPDGTVIGIDEGIAPLLTALWRAGVATVNSCESHVDQLVYVVLADMSDLSKLLHCLSMGPLAVAIMNDDIGAPDSSPETKGQFRYRLRPVNPHGHGEWRYIVSVEFPATYLTEVERCLRLYG